MSCNPYGTLRGHIIFSFLLSRATSLCDAKSNTQNTGNKLLKRHCQKVSMSTLELKTSHLKENII